LACVLLAEEAFEAIQTVGPEAFVEAQPLLGAGERAGIKAAQVGAATNLAADQPGTLQCLDVLRGGREGDCEGLGKVTYRSLTTGKVAQHLPTCGIAEGMEDGVEPSSM
jgi:hypothetical protein